MLRSVQAIALLYIVHDGGALLALVMIQSDFGTRGQGGNSNALSTQPPPPILLGVLVPQRCAFRT